MGEKYNSLQSAEYYLVGVGVGVGIRVLAFRHMHVLVMEVNMCRSVVVAYKYVAQLTA